MFFSTERPWENSAFPYYHGFRTFSISFFFPTLFLPTSSSSQHLSLTFILQQIQIVKHCEISSIIFSSFIGQHVLAMAMRRARDNFRRRYMSDTALHPRPSTWVVLQPSEEQALDDDEPVSADPENHVGNAQGMPIEDPPNLEHQEITSTEAIGISSEGSGDRGATAILPPRPSSGASVGSTEPFPAYDPNDLQPPTILYQAQEAAYEWTLSRYAQDLRERGGLIQNCSIVASQASTSFPAGNNRVPGYPSLAELDNMAPCPEPVHYNHFCLRHEFVKLGLRNNITKFFQKEEAIQGTRYREETIRFTHMVIRMEEVFYSSRNFPQDPLRHVTVPELYEVRSWAAEMTQYLSQQGNRVFDELNKASLARYQVECLLSQCNLTPLQKLKQIARIIIL